MGLVIVTVPVTEALPLTTIMVPTGPAEGDNVRVIGAAATGVKGIAAASRPKIQAAENM